jgi:hypothetical protein
VGGGCGICCAAPDLGAARNAAIAIDLALAVRGEAVVVVVTVRALEGRELEVSLDLTLVRCDLPCLAGGVMGCGCVLWREAEAWLVAGRFRRDPLSLTGGVSVWRGVRIVRRCGVGLSPCCCNGLFSAGVVYGMSRVR